MTITGRQVVLAVDAAVQTWGARRRSTPGTDPLGPEGMGRAVIDELPPAQDLGPDAKWLLDGVCQLDREGRRWSYIRKTIRDRYAEVAVALEAMEAS